MKRGLALAVALLAAAPAQAHLVSSGVGPVYDGALHLLLSPSDVLAVLALALLAGQNGAAAARMTILVLPAAWLLGGLAAVAFPVPDLAMPTWPALLLLGPLLAASLRLPVRLVASIAGVLGLAQGVLSGNSLAAAQSGTASLVGMATLVLLLTTLASAAAATRRSMVERTMVRVLGSWTGAIGLLALGWSLR